MAARMITVHTMGGPDMMKAAMDASRELAERTQQERPLVLGVTILTSLQDSDMHHIGVRRKTASQVKHLAELAQKSGLDGIVCSPRELSLIRPECDKKFLLVTPGIRPKDADAGDQRRTLTPKEAIEQGADYIVIGRPITEAQDPRAAAEAILKEVQQARRKV
jgi:orotidine-5'-phosphate decarboxylase